MMLPIIIPGNARRTVLFDVEAGMEADPEVIGALEVAELMEGVAEVDDIIEEIEEGEV